MTTAQDRLNQILPSWYDLLTQWSLDGSLIAAATDALMLDSSNAKQDAKGQLQSYVSQWSAGNFKSLPQIVLLSAADISGARGAYADSTDTIYLNQEWLLGASAEDIQAVLTEELGHYLDDQLNQVDTKGDEGDYFSSLLFDANISNATSIGIQSEDDSILINIDSRLVSAEASAAPSSKSYLSLDFGTGDYLSANAKYIPESGDFTVSVWAKANSFPFSDESEIISQGRSGDNGFYIGRNGDGYFRIGDSWGGWAQTGNGVRFPDDGQWHCYQVVKSGSTGYLYLDGALVASSEGYSDEVVGTSGFKNPTGGSNLRIGNQFATDNGGDYQEYWNGSIDEVKIFGSALSAEELENVRLSTSAPESLIYTADFESDLTSFDLYGSPSIVKGSASYENSTYTIVSGSTFDEARLNAQKLGGDLVVLNSQGEFDFLVNAFQGYQSEYQSLWIGITDLAEEGKWLNVDGTLAGYAFNGDSDFLPWHIGEPNDFNGEDYGALNWSQYWTEQYALGREGVRYPAGLNDLSISGTFGDDKPIFGIAEIRTPQTTTIGSATSDAGQIIVSGDLTAPIVESYSTSTSGRGKTKTTIGSFVDVAIDQTGPLDALTINGGQSNNVITGNGFVDNTNTSINETRSAFTGVLVIDGKGGADTITGGVSGTNWLIGGGVAGGSVDTLTGTASSKDIFDLRQSATSGVWSDAYSTGGNAVINNFDPLKDLIVLSGDSYSYVPKETTVFKGKRPVGTKLDGFDILDSNNKLIGSVLGSGFSDTNFAKYVATGQSSQSPFDATLPDGSTIL